VLDEDDEVDEIAHPGVLAIAEVAEHGMELLGGVPVDIDDLDLRGGDAGELERVG
jgi:hypothetical protein